MEWLLAMDMDGTLVRRDGTIPDEVADALRQISGNGVHLMLATGRMRRTCEIISKSIGGAHIAAFNGSVTVMPDGTAIERTIDSATLDHIASFCRGRGVYMQVYDRDVICVDHACPELMGDLDTRLNGYVELGNLSAAVLAPSPKAVIVDFDAGLITSMREELGCMFPDLTITQSSPCVIEILPGGVDKGYAVKLISESLGIPRERIAAIGDGHNDISMIEFAGTGVAVANADPLLKERADRVTVREGPYGVLEMIEELFSDWL